MNVNVLGEKVEKAVATQYVKEFLKTRHEKNISSVDLIVKDGFLKVRCIYEGLPNIA